MSEKKLRPARDGDALDAHTRGIIVENTRHLRAEIEQIFIDCAYWNEHVRKPHEKPVDPDPDGRLRREADKLDEWLRDELRPM